MLAESVRLSESRSTVVERDNNGRPLILPLMLDESFERSSLNEENDALNEDGPSAPLAFCWFTKSCKADIAANNYTNNDDLITIELPKLHW